ncbi:unnamed protein product [Rotaria sp. Silwood2]|nr:unnamed protein product [Rotaria sp. Silwood2]
MHHTASGDEGYASINEFREKVPLTTYEDYRAYIDRMVFDGERNLLSSEDIVYFSTSSGTTGKMKLLPLVAETMKKIGESTRIGTAITRRSFPPSSLPVPEQRTFNLLSGKKTEMFQRSKDGIPIGPLSQSFSAFSSIPRNRSLFSTNNTVTLDMIEEIPDFETSVFVQLVFALATSNICSYSTALPPVFIHTVKMIENYFDEMSLCISYANFAHSSLVQNNISDSEFIASLNRTLNEATVKYGGEVYRLERAKHIRNECLKKDAAGILHRLWPNLIYASAAIGSTFSMYKKEVQFYCGERLPLINMGVYISSEGPLGVLASIHTDEYFLLPTCVFFEFIKEEDVEQVRCPS